MSTTLDVLVIGGGQAGLALGFYLRRTPLAWKIVDAQPGPGGAWRHTWKSMRLFSPARFSSLPGWVMEGGPDYYPTRDEALEYLRRYEERYGLEVERPYRVLSVRREGEELVAEGTAAHGEMRSWRARAVVSATGTWERPFVPDVPGRLEYAGAQVHSAAYESPEPFAGRRVLVVGGGNSGAQIQAELSQVADSKWVTLREPRFLPDHVDGRYLFDEATARWRAHQAAGRVPFPEAGGDADRSGRPSLGDIVMVPAVREARARDALASVRPFTRFTRTGVVWPDGREEPVDAVVWCTGFLPALGHLGPLGVLGIDGRVQVAGTRSLMEPRLWLVGYGDWTGFASATLIAVGRTARSTVHEISELLSAKD